MDNKGDLLNQPVSERIKKQAIFRGEKYALWNRIYVVLIISVAVGIYLFILKSKPKTAEISFNRTQVEVENVVELDAKKYIPAVLNACIKYKTIYPVDPLLVFGLMKGESKLDEDAVSYAGAAGLMQLIPDAVKQKDAFVFKPDFLNTARRNREKMLGYRDKAYQCFNDNDYAQATVYKKLSDKYAQKADILYKKYRKLLEGYKDKDRRFDPGFSIDAGVRILAGNLKSRDGDIREALAAYNAGGGAVRRFDGIPPINETILFQNKVINYYKDYLKDLKTEGK